MMMNPHVFSLFLLLFLSSSITAHTSLRVRLTEKALPVVKRFGLQFLEALLNKPFQDFKPLETRWAEIVIRGLTLTRLPVNPDQVDLRFMENSGLRFEIRDLHFTAQLRRQGNVQFFGTWNIHDATTIITGRGVNATIDVRLNRQGGQLKVEMSNCEFGAEALNLDSNSNFGRAIDFVLMWTRVIETQLCPAVRSLAVPKVDAMLRNLHVVKLDEEHQLSVENSASDDVTVTRRSIDVPFRSTVFWREKAANPPVTGTDVTQPPDIPGSDLMAYVAFSDGFLNSFLQSLHRAGPFKVPIPKKWALKKLNLPEGDAEVKLTEPPSASISQTGVSVALKASIQTLVTPEIQPLDVECNIELVFSIRGTKLLPVLFGSSRKGSCKVTTGNIFIEGLANIFLKLISLFDVGEQLPLPEGLSFTQSKIRNNDGYVVVGGSLEVAAAVAQRAAQQLTNNI